MDKRRQPLVLMQKGFSLLDQHRHADALKVGRKLKQMRHSSAFEILALAHLGAGRPSKAIAVLEEGVTLAGKVWVLWELLGNCRSDAGRFVQAEKAYTEALARHGCDRDLVHLNRAIAFNRAGNHLEAKTALRHVKSPRLRRRADACRIRVALELGESGTAHRLALGLCRRRPSAAETYDDANRSEILLACSLALKDSPSSRLRALRLAFRAVESWPGNREALGLIRTMQRRATGRHRMFRLLIHGEWASPPGGAAGSFGFFRTVEVAATDPIAALRHAKRFFPGAVRPSLSVSETSTLRNPAVAAEGVHFLSGYHFYPARRTRR